MGGLAAVCAVYRVRRPGTVRGSRGEAACLVQGSGRGGEEAYVHVAEVGESGRRHGQCGWRAETIRRRCEYFGSGKCEERDAAESAGWCSVAYTCKVRVHVRLFVFCTNFGLCWTLKGLNMYGPA